MKSIIRPVADYNWACGEAQDWLLKNINRSDKWLWDHCSHGDWMTWWLNAGKVPIAQKIWVELAVYMGKLSLAIFEKWAPQDKRPKVAIEAAIAWLKHPTEKNKNLAAKAARDAGEAYKANTAASEAAKATANVAFAAANTARAATYTAYAIEAASNAIYEEAYMVANEVYEKAYTATLAANVEEDEAYETAYTSALSTYAGKEAQDEAYANFIRSKLSWATIKKIIKKEKI